MRGVMKEEGRTMSELLREALRLYMEQDDCKVPENPFMVS